jgi:hypothetical protein
LSTKSLVHVKLGKVAFKSLSNLGGRAAK